ncbi:MAG TPA: hypothetical protein VJQ57_13825 [Acidimicrobiia bacterium]|nr:hypothetical protein [Acidimicrobiia bacterium]
MSYIQAFTKSEGEVTLPEDADITAELDSEPIAFCARLLTLVDDLDEDDVIIIRKVVY